MYQIKESAPTSPTAVNTPFSELMSVPNRLFRRPDQFERLYKTDLDALDRV